MDKPFRIDAEKVRAHAREQINAGAVTAAYNADRKQVVAALNGALATEHVCVLRYKNHYYMAAGIHAQSVADEFLEHANQEQGHADAIAARINQLGGVPNFDPKGLAERSHAEYREGTTIESMLRENLVAERVAIETYTAMVRWLGDDDPTTRKLVEDILRVEEEHAEDLANFLQGFPQDRAQ